MPDFNSILQLTYTCRAVRSQRVPDGADALNGPLSVADRITRSHNLDTAAVYRLIPALLVHFVWGVLGSYHPA